MAELEPCHSTILRGASDLQEYASRLAASKLLFGAKAAKRWSEQVSGSGQDLTYSGMQRRLDLSGSSGLSELLRAGASLIQQKLEQLQIPNMQCVSAWGIRTPPATPAQAMHIDTQDADGSAVKPPEAWSEGVMVLLYLTDAAPTRLCSVSSEQAWNMHAYHHPTRLDAEKHFPAAAAVSAGDLAIFRETTWHFGPGNPAGSEERRLITFLFRPQGMQPEKAELRV
jgi:hypothetical protein